MLFKLMTYNILDGGINREQLILKVLKTVEPDVILLQEVICPDVVQRFAKALNMHIFLAEGNSKRHLAVLSRFPITFSCSYHPFPLRHALLEVAIEFSPSQLVYLFGVHLVAHYVALCEWWRSGEIKTVLKRVARYRSSPCLIAGDFNTVARKDQIDTKVLPVPLKTVLLFQGGRIFKTAIAKVLSAGFIDCYRALHSYDNGFTLPTPAPHVRLDYIFADQSLESHLRWCDVVSAPPEVHKASDHYPVAAEFEL